MNGSVRAWMAGILFVAAGMWGQDAIAQNRMEAPSSPAPQKIDDITGYSSLLGEESFRSRGEKRQFTLDQAIQVAMEKSPIMNISALGLERSLADLDLTESEYRNTYRLSAQAQEELQRLSGGKFRIDPEKGLIREDYRHYENRELFTLSPVYQRTFRDASRLRIAPRYQYIQDSDAAFDASATDSTGRNFDNQYSVDMAYDYYLNSRPREQIRQQMENAKLSVVQADYDLYQTQKETKDSVISQYWRIKQLEEEVEIQIERLIQARRIEFIIKTQYEFENASEMEVGQAQIDVQNNEATLIDYEGNLRSAVEAFNYILGIPLETDVELPEALEVEPLPLASVEYIALVTDSNLELKNLRIGIQKLENSLRVARLGQQPEFLLSGGFSRDDEGQEDYSAALVFSWAFGDGGATRARVQSLATQLEQQQIQLWNRERALVREVYDDLRSLQLLEKQIAIQEENVRKAYINLENALFNFQEFGRISFRDMQDFQLDLTRSRSGLVRAKVSYNLAKSSLMRKVHEYEPSPEAEPYLDLIRN